jgi:non-specific protein-tyrosine kinase
LTNVLIGAVPLDRAMQTWAGAEQPLLVLPSGPIPPNPSELLGSKAMAGMLAELEHRVDLVLIDASPLLPVTDSPVLSTSASGAIVVAHAGKTSRDQLRASAEALAAVDARILGVVLNFVPTKGPNAYSHYGYHYRYQPGATPTVSPAIRQPVAPPPQASPPIAEPAPASGVVGSAPAGEAFQSAPASASGTASEPRVPDTDSRPDIAFGERGSRPAPETGAGSVGEPGIADTDPTLGAALAENGWHANGDRPAAERPAESERAEVPWTGR